MTARAEILGLLPAVFRRSVAEKSALDALVALMEHLHAAPEARLAAIDEVLDPRRAPDPFVPVLARWVDLDPELASGTDRLRALVALASELLRWQGTARGLAAFLQVATGADTIRVDDAVADKAGGVRPFHLLVVAPAALRPYEDALEAIVAREKPAYVTHKLTFE
jgi:phage tail-like protein